MTRLPDDSPTNVAWLAGFFTAAVLLVGLWAGCSDTPVCEQDEYRGCPSDIGGEAGE